MKKNQFLKESDVPAESVFFMKRRQVLKALGISAAALSLPHAAHADLLSWFKGNDLLFYIPSLKLIFLCNFANSYIHMLLGFHL